MPHHTHTNNITHYTPSSEEQLDIGHCLGKMRFLSCVLCLSPFFLLCRVDFQLLYWICLKSSLRFHAALLEVKILLTQ